MADFCKACSLEHFGEDVGDLAEITDPGEWQEGRATVVICEGCGPIQVDPEGNCASDDCFCQGEAGHGSPLVEMIQEKA